MQMSPHYSYHSNRRTNIRMFKQQFREAQLSSDVCMPVCACMSVLYIKEWVINRFTNGP